MYIHVILWVFYSQLGHWYPSIPFHFLQFQKGAAAEIDDLYSKKMLQFDGNNSGSLENYRLEK